ncbi:MAG: imelysin family protein [Porticoccaceae bacterium]|nr:imelysin family protein [Porticoccaceae bacterium]
MTGIKRFVWILLMVGLVGCVDKSRDLTPTLSISDEANSADEASIVIDRNAVMTNLVDNVFIPNYKSTADSSAIFASNTGALADYCESIDTAVEVSKKAAAKTAWRDLMDKVQQTEIHVIGPALRNEGALQSRIHSYTTGNLAKCAVDQSVIQLNESTDFSVAIRALNQRGMRAIEYLLFNDNMNHSCSSQVPTTSNWHALSEPQRVLQRCNLALELAGDVAYASGLIYDGWTADNSSFRTEFLSESNRSDNFQQITDALFYIETYTKSGKLAIPLGLDPKCSGITCPDLVESPYSESSLRDIQVNIQEFLRIFNGDSGIGFDDLIADAGFADIANRFKSQSTNVINKVDEIQTSLSTQLATILTSNEETACINAQTNPDDESILSVCSLAGLIKRITDDLKIDFVAVVNVPVPGRVQSDND